MEKLKIKVLDAVIMVGLFSPNGEILETPGEDLDSNRLKD